MQSLELNLIHTILLSMIVLFVGRALVANIGVLQRFSIPAPVVGGGVVAILLALADGLGGIKVSFDMALKDALLLMFFTTIGLAADARMLAKGGMKLLVFLGISVALVVAQNVVGIGTALAFDLHPVIGMFGGSITLVGGHGTGAAYAGRLGETMNLQGAMELAMAAATAGLVIGAILGGPVTEYLIKRHKLAGPAAASGDTAAAQQAGAEEVNSRTLVNTLFVVLACLAGGKVLAHVVEGEAPEQRGHERRQHVAHGNHDQQRLPGSLGHRCSSLESPRPVTPSPTCWTSSTPSAARSSASPRPAGTSTARRGSGPTARRTGTRWRRSASSR